MPSVSIDVGTYKRMFNRLCYCYEQFDPDFGLDYLMEQFEFAPLPDWVCNHCGYVSEGDFEKNLCPRCNCDPTTQEPKYQ